MKLNYSRICLFLFVTTLMLLTQVASYSQGRVNYRHAKRVNVAVGFASFYADKFEGRKTASGERFSQKKMTCAHNTYPMGTRVRVTNLSNQRSVIVKVNDRLHHRNARLVDLSKSAARKIGLSKRGVTKVKVERLR